MNAKRLNRSEVPVEQTWNLVDLFESRETWQSMLEENARAFDDLTQFKGILANSPETLYTCMVQLEAAYSDLVRLSTYASLRQSEDGTNPINQEDGMLLSSVSTTSLTKIAFIASEITALDAEAYHALYKNKPALNTYKNYLDELYDLKKHKLSPETEEVLASLGEALNAPYRTYSISKAADMKFDDFEVPTQDVTLPNSFALYETKYEFSPDAEVRHMGYVGFNKTLHQYKNTYASIYATEVKKQVALSKLRNYPSVTEMLLHSQKVSLEMYNRQIDLIYTKLAPHMQKFAQIKKEALGQETLHYWDLKAPLDYSFNPPADYMAIKETLLKALSILGKDYLTIIERAFEERWIDYSDNIGKATGAFCASPYGVHSYILISYQESMRSAFTLAHELGHAGHFMLANKEQRIFDTRPSTYFVEAPSTMNEILLADYLMKQEDHPRMKRWVILQLMGTYYHNFVTHLLEAEFQRRVYAFAEQGGSLTSKFLCETKLNVIRTFWGDSVSIDEDAGLTWMRQPHYYMGLYPYTYSAGLTASTAIATQIFKEGQPAIDRWLEVLKAGGSLSPEALLKSAGIDMTTAAPIESAIEYVGSLIDELEVLFKN